MSCTDEAAKARRNSALRVMWPSETSLAVTVVPMLAPMTMKMALRTPMASAATIPIMMLVVVDELCTMVVARMPMNRPINGEEVASRIFCENSLPNNLKEYPIPPIPTRNR